MRENLLVEFKCGFTNCFICIDISKNKMYTINEVVYLKANKSAHLARRIKTSVRRFRKDFTINNKKRNQSISLPVKAAFVVTDSTIEKMKKNKLDEKKIISIKKQANLLSSHMTSGKE